MKANEGCTYCIKPPTTYDEQVQILANRNLIIGDWEEAKEILKRVNYYRFSAYMLSLKNKNDNVFIEGTTFNEIYNLYEFDKKLRNLLTGILESIEVSFRTHIAYCIAHEYGPLGYLEEEHFVNTKYHSKFIKELNTDIYRRKDELYIRHHIKKYDNQFPVWVALETISFTCLSKLFSNLMPEDKTHISKKYYGIPYRYISNWLYVLSNLRNICAHYGRLYDRVFTAKIRMDKKDIRLGFSNDRVFCAIFIMKKLCLDPIEWDSFVIELSALIETYKVVDLELIGFPENWEELLIS